MPRPAPQQFANSFGAMVRDVDTDLGHRLDGQRIERARIDARAGDLEPVASQVAEPAVSNLAPRGVLRTDKENAVVESRLVVEHRARVGETHRVANRISLPSVGPVGRGHFYTGCRHRRAGEIGRNCVNRCGRSVEWRGNPTASTQVMLERGRRYYWTSCIDFAFVEHATAFCCSGQRRHAILNRACRTSRSLLQLKHPDG